MKKIIYFVLAFLLIGSPAIAKKGGKGGGKSKSGKGGSFIRGGGRFKNPFVNTTQIGDAVTISITGSRSGRYSSSSSTVTLIVNKSELTEGAEIDLTTGQNSGAGVANINISNTRSNRGGTTISSSDGDSEIGGTLMVVSVDGSNVTLAYKGKLTNTRVSRNSRERRGRRTKISGMFTIQCP